MPCCTDCATPLRTIRQREGIFFFCDQCSGRAVTLPQIRRVAGDQFATRLLHKIDTSTEVTGRRCPFCLGKMRRFYSDNPLLELDACKPCEVVWFDAREFEAVPEGIVETSDELLLRGCESAATWKLQQLAEQDRRESGAAGQPPDEEWKWVPAFLGLPVKMEDAGLSRRPWVTWSLSAGIAVLSVLAFSKLESAVSLFGFIPAQPWRYGGATFLTSFLIHAGWWHLMSNLYFLLLFGDSVEDYLGRRRFVVLVLLSTIAGDLLHLAIQSHSTIPSIGASGGIAGVIAFYALEFPRVRLGFLLRFYFWVQLPAWGAFGLWLLLQFIGAYEQVAGFSKVNAFAHLGGTAAGVCAWMAWRKLNPDPTEGSTR